MDEILSYICLLWPIESYFSYIFFHFINHKNPLNPLSVKFGMLCFFLLFVDSLFSIKTIMDDMKTYWPNLQKDNNTNFWWVFIILIILHFAYVSSITFDFYLNLISPLISGRIFVVVFQQILKFHKANKYNTMIGFWEIYHLKIIIIRIKK